MPSSESTVEASRECPQMLELSILVICCKLEIMSFSIIKAKNILYLWSYLFSHIKYSPFIPDFNYGNIFCILCAMLSYSVVPDSATPWTIASQALWSIGILQARLLEWVAMPSSRGSSRPRDWTQVSHIAGGSFTIWATREALNIFKFKVVFKIWHLLFIELAVTKLSSHLL